MLTLFYNFHHKHSLLKLKIRKLSPKINVKNMNNQVKYYVQGKLNVLHATSLELLNAKAKVLFII